MISVIVLTYNQEQYIAQALDSILMQQVDEPVEIIIGNDNSIDRTQDICEHYLTLYPDKIRLFNNVSNLGLVKNFIKMLKQCQGEYIALCDGDDYWTDSQKLQKQVDVFRKNKHVVLVHTNRNFLKGNKIINAKQLEKQKIENKQELLLSSYICVPTVMFMAQFVQEWLSEYERLVFEHDWRMQDYPLWLYLGTCGDFYYIPKATAVYRVLDNTLSREQDKNKAYRFDKSVLNVKKYFYSAYRPDALFERRFYEMEFHARKRMLIDYGWLAREQILPLLKLLPYYPYILRHKLQKIKL